jgi:mannose-6-phosphate isomerase
MSNHVTSNANNFSESINSGVALTTGNAEILFAIDGPITLIGQHDEHLTLTIGQSAFVPASTGDYRVTAEGRFARASNR